jgi:hypothetical protein
MGSYLNKGIAVSSLVMNAPAAYFSLRERWTGWGKK